MVGVAVLAAVAAACAGDLRPPNGAADALRLIALPQTGAAPLQVTLVATLADDFHAAVDLDCPSVAWNFGDGPALIQQRDCTDEPRRAFSIDHVYTTPGSYEATARLLGAGIATTAPVQIVVGGPTPTAVAAGVLGFPPAVVTAPAETGEEAGASAGALGAPSGALGDDMDAALEALGADEALADLELPADVLFLAGPARADPPPPEARAVWRLGAKALPDSPPNAGARLLAETASDTAIDVSTLTAEGALTASLTAGQEPPEGMVPLALDPARRTLALRSERGELTLYDLEGRELRDLPVRAGAAGWLVAQDGASADESVMWLSDPGLRLLTVGDSLQLTNLLDQADVSGVTATDSGGLLAVIGQGASHQLVEFDLASGSLTPESIGEPFEVGASETAVPAPDGSGVLVYGPRGARFVDRSGSEHWLLHGPVRKALWDESR